MDDEQVRLADRLDEQVTVEHPPGRRALPACLHSEHAPCRTQGGDHRSHASRLPRYPRRKRLCGEVALDGCREEVPGRLDEEGVDLVEVLRRRWCLQSRRYAGSHRLVE